MSDTFKDTLLADINAKKRQFEEAKVTCAKKYMRRAELERNLTEQKGSIASEDPSAKLLASDDSDQSIKVSTADAQDVPELLFKDSRELDQNLREQCLPTRLFGETEEQRALRLEHSVANQDHSHGQRVKGLTEFTESKKERDVAYLVDPMETEAVSLALLKMDGPKARSLIILFLKRLLREWEDYLEARSDETKVAVAGRTAASNHLQSVQYLRPFFRQLKRDQLPKDVLEGITDICAFMQAREYVRANDRYLRLSIGNAPWPIGVTMVGIHERSAREKINTSQVARML